MAGKNNFPQQLTVSRVDDTDDDPYLTIHEDGIQDENIKENREVAIYNLAEVGEIIVERRYKKAGK